MTLEVESRTLEVESTTLDPPAAIVYNESVVAQFNAGGDGIPPARGCLEGMPLPPVHGMFGRNALLAELRARVLAGEGEVGEGRRSAGEVCRGVPRGGQ
jgi:hypothetical protein